MSFREILEPDEDERGPFESWKVSWSPQIMGK